MKEKRTQLKMVSDHLRRYRKITSWSAIEKYRITRLAEWIRVLRSQGWLIESVWKEKKGKRWVEYRLLEGTSNLTIALEPINDAWTI